MPTRPSRQTRFYRHNGLDTPPDAPYAGRFVNICVICRRPPCRIVPVALRFAPHGEDLCSSAQVAFSAECGGAYTIIFGMIEPAGGAAGYVCWSPDASWAEACMRPDPVRFLGPSAARLDPDDVERFVEACGAILEAPENHVERSEIGYMCVSPDGFETPLLIPNVHEPVLWPADQARIVAAHRAVVARCQVALPLPLELL